MVDALNRFCMQCKISFKAKTRMRFKFRTKIGFEAKKVYHAQQGDGIAAAEGADHQMVRSLRVGDCLEHHA